MYASRCEGRREYRRDAQRDAFAFARRRGDLAVNLACLEAARYAYVTRRGEAPSRPPPPRGNTNLKSTKGLANARRPLYRKENDCLLFSIMVSNGDYSCSVLSLKLPKSFTGRLLCDSIKNDKALIIQLPPPQLPRAAGTKLWNKQRSPADVPPFGRSSAFAWDLSFGFYE